MIEKRNMEVTACNLSSNIITKIPPKFPTSFNLITGMKNYFRDFRDLEFRIYEFFEQTFVKFIYSEKATKFFEISTNYLTSTT